MRLDEASEIIKQRPYNFSSNEIEFDVSEGVEDGETLAMIWIDTWGTLPPRELRHDPSLQDKRGWSCAKYWKKYVSRNVPQELL